MKDRVGQVLEGKYRLVRLLGKGGMGAVYEAEHTVISRSMAVKLLHVEFAESAEMAERFVREAKSASAIGHPNIIEIQDVGRTDDGAVFIVMELLKGQSLTDLIRARGRIGPRRAIALTLQVLSGLQAAHRKGIIHRDLKPDNIYLKADKLGEQVKILDFGISKVKGAADAVPGLTKTGTVMGTPYYMAPEQARGEKDVDERIDVWSVGVMLYQMLSGSLPFPGESYNAVVSKILTDPVPHLDRAAPDVPARLVEVVHRALEKDRKARYASVEALMEALEALLEDASIRTAPDPDDAEAATARPGSLNAGGAGTPDVQVEAYAPTTPAGKEALSTAPGAREPLWKFVTWYLVILLLQFPLWGGIITAPHEVLSALGIPRADYLWLALLVHLLLSGGLLGVGLLIARFWSRRTWNAWLQGPGFIVFPAVGLLLIFYHSIRLNGQLDSHMASLRSYAAVNATQAATMTDLISNSLHLFLNSVFIDQSIVWVLASMVLLGYLFLRQHGKAPRPDRKRWLILPAGLIFIAVVDNFLGHRPPEDMGPLRFHQPLYFVWIITAAAVLRMREPQVKGFQPAWGALFSGVVAAVAFKGVQVTLAYVSTLESLGRSSFDQMPVEERAWLFNRVLTPDLVVGMIVDLGILILLLASLVVVCRHAFPFSFDARSIHKTLLPSVGTVIIIAFPMLVLLNAMNRIGDQWLPLKIETMQPAALKKGEPPSFYIDRSPQALYSGRTGLFVALTGRDRKDLDMDLLKKSLSGFKACPGVLSASLSKKEPREPARCLTAVEARLYCEALGKRLPTPEEWDAALAEVSLGEGGEDSNQTLSRGQFGEWTMRLIHGTPAFEIRGADAAEGIPAQLAPDSFSPKVGFRCVFTFSD